MFLTDAIQLGTMKSAIYFAVFVACAVAGPLDRSGPCSRQCTESRKFAYKPGTSYIYDYETRSETTMQGTFDEKASLKLTCQVEMEVLDSCDFAIQLKNVLLEEEDPRNPQIRSRSKDHQEFKDALESQPLRFSFQDGKIDSVCPSEDESPRALNIKKGILSMLQNSMQKLEGSEDLQETDISGKCPTIYESLGRGWSSLTIRKSKDLGACKNRESSESALQATPEHENTIKSRPVVKGSQECTQTFRNDILNKVVCKETHVVRPFSRQENGAITTIQQSLSIRTQKKGRLSPNGIRSSKPTELLFDHDYEGEDSNELESIARRALQDMDNAVPDEVTSAAPGKFLELVYSLRKLKFDSLQRIYRNAEPGKQRKYIEDALPAVGTAASVRMMTEAVMKNDVSGAGAEMWLSSFAFIPKPDPEMISQASVLLKSGHSQAYLALSTLAHTYCRSHPDCGSVPEIKDLVGKLFANLGENCYARDGTATLLTLKAIGNIGQADGKEDILQNCYKNPQLDIETRVAAIQAFRRITCDIPRNDLLKLFENTKEDIELRIAAYLAVMKCPSSAVIQTVKETLEEEPIKQVGSFVFSHIRNFGKHNSNFRKDVQAITSSLPLMNRFQLDLRKFSRNIHYNMFFDPLDSGFDVDSNIIYTTESFMPRAVSFNLTCDIFGHHTNLFETGMRFERLEQIFEKLYRKKMDNSIRPKRAIDDNKIEEFDNQFKIKSKYSQEPTVSAYMKIFGNEILYGKMGGNSYDSYNILDALVKLADPKGVDFTKSALFMDTSLTIPTGSGFPLKLTATGTTTASLKVGGKFQIRSSSEVDINGKFQPSGAVEISTFMTVDAHKAQTGVKMVATLSSSSVVDGVIQVQNGQAMKLQLNVPRDQIEILDVKSKIFLVNSGSQIEHRNDQEKKMSMQSCTGPTIDRALGIRLCASAEFPVSSRGKSTPMYPFSGPAEVKVVLQKTDPSLRSYVFNTQWKNENGVKSGLITANTPGSQVNRELTLEVQHNEQDKTVSLKVQTPPKKISVDAKYNFESEQLKLDVDTRVDDQSIFQIISELKSDSSQGSRGKSSVKYTPFLEIRSRGSRVFLLNGQWSAANGRKYNGNLNIEDLTEDPIDLQVDLDLGDKNKVKGELNVKSSVLDGALSGFIQSGDNWSTKMTCEFSFMKGKKEKVDFTAKFRDLSASSLTKYSGVLSFQNTLHPDLNTEINLESQKTEGHLENSLQITTGEGRRNRGNHITIQQILRYAGTLNHNNVGVTLKLKYPEKKIDWSLEMKHENSEKNIANRMTVMYAPNRQLSTQIEGSIDPEMKADIQVSYPGRSMRLSGKADKNDDEYKGEVLAQWQRGKQVQMSGSFKEGRDRRGYNPSLELQINMPQRSPVIVNIGMKSSRGTYGINGAAEYGSMKYNLNGEYKSSGPWDHTLKGKLQTPSDEYSTNCKLSVHDGQLKANADIQMGADRQITAKALLSNSDNKKSASIDVSWDAGRDQSKRLSLDAELNGLSNGYQGTFGLKSPIQNVRGTFSTSIQGRVKSGSLRINNQAEIEWQPRRKLSLNLNAEAAVTSNRRSLKSDLLITTPFKSMSNFGLAITHNDDGKEWNNNVKVSLPGNDAVSVGSDGSVQFDRYSQKVKATVKVAVPSADPVTASFQHQLTSSEISEKVELEWSRRSKISAEVSGAQKADGLSGTLKVNTPFRGYEEFTAEASGSQNNGGVLGKVKITTPFRAMEELTAEASASLNNGRANGDFKITTPIRGYEQFSGELSCAQTSRGINGNLKLRTPFRGYEEFSGEVLGSNNGEKITGELKLRTPFRGYEENSAAIEHKLTRNSLLSKAELRWGNNKMLLVELNGRHSGSGPKSCEGSLKIQSSFEGAENLLTKVSYNNDGTKINADAELASGNKKITTGISLLKSGSRCETKVYFTSPIVNYENLEASLVHSGGLEQFKANFEAKLPYSKSASVRAQGRVSSPSDFEASITANVPIRRYERWGLEVSHKLQSSSVRSSVQLSMGSQKITAEMNGNHVSGYRSREISGNLLITTPFAGYEELKADVKHTQQQQTYISQIEANKGANRISLSHELKFQDMCNFANQLEIRTPFESLKTVSLKNKCEKSSGRFQHNSELEWARNKRVALSVQASSKSTRYETDLNTGIKVTTPWSSLSTLSVDASYNADQQTRKPQLLIEWNNNKKISLEGSLSNERNQKINGRLALMTSFRDYENIVLSGKVDTTGRQKTAELSLQWDPRSNSLLSISGTSLITSESADIQLLLVTPVQGFERVELKTEYQNSGNSISGSVSAQSGRKQILLNGKGETSRNGASGEISLSTPFKVIKQQKLSGQYSIQSKRASGEIIAEWADQRVSLETELQKNNNRASAKVLVKTPYRGYESVLLSLRGDLDAEKKELSGLLEWDANKIELNSEFQVNPSGTGNVKVEFRSPFTNMEEFIFEGQLEKNGQESRLTSSAQWDPRKQISVNAAVSQGASELTINTPFRNYKELKYTGKLESSSGSSDLNINLEWNRDKKASLNLYKRIAGNSLEGGMKLTTPFEQFDDISISAKASNEGIRSMEGTLKINSPYEPLKDLEINCQYRQNRGGYSASAKMTTPKSTYELNGELACQGLQSVDGKLSLSTPHSALRNLDVTVNMKSNGLRSVDGELVINTPNAAHSLSVVLKNDETMEGSLKVKCPWLEARILTLGYKLNIADPSNIEGSLFCETPEVNHRIAGSYKNNGRIHEAELKLESPLLKNGPASAKMSYSNRRNKEVKMTALVGTPKAMHSIVLEGENERSRMSGKLSMEGEYFPMKSLTAEGSVSFGNQNAEAELTVKTHQSTHSLNAGYKFAEGMYNGDMAIHSPLFSFKTLSGNINWKTDYEQGEGSLSIGTPSKVVKVSGKVKKPSSGSVEASLNIETPWEPLTSFTAEASLNNEYNRNIDGSLTIQSSHPSLRDISVSGKLLRSYGNEDASINIRLPSRELPSIGLHFVVNYKNDLSSFSPRLTITLPRTRYSTYADCKLIPGDYSITAGQEWGSGRKVEVICTAKSSRDSLNMKASLTTPFRDMELYEAEYAYALQGNEATIKATYKGPSNRMSVFQSTVNYYNLLNFNAEASLITPIRGLESISTKVRQQSSRYRFISSVEQSWAHGQKVSLNIDHDKRDQKGSVQLKTPMRSVRNARFVYNVNSDRLETELTLNDDTIVKVNGGSYITDARNYQRDIVIDIPALKINIGGHYKLQRDAYEITLKCNTEKRNIQFHTSQQNSGNTFAHGSQLKWGEGRGEEISYDFRTIESSRRDVQTTDIIGRINFPLRSFEVKTTLSQKTNSRSLTCDIYWDVARDPQKHLTINLQHDDLSSRSAWAHKLQASLAHPRLSKDISVICEASVSSDEIYGKSEIEYSGNPRHNMLLEARARDLASGRRNTHYTVEVNARQPVSNIDVKLSGDIQDNRQQSSAALSVDYLNRNNQKRVHELKANLQKQKQEIALSARSGENEAKITGKMFNHDLEYSASVEHAINNEMPTRSSLRISKRHATMDFTYATPEDSGIMFKAAAPEDKMFMEVSHKSLGKAVSDLLVTVGLREKQYIGSELKWRPESVDEASEYISKSYSSISSKMSDFLELFSEEAYNELRAKSRLMSSSWQQEIRPLVEDLEKELKGLQNDINQASKRLQTMYYYDEFYLKTIVTAAEDVLSSMGKVLCSASNLVAAAVRQTAWAVWNTGCQVCSSLAKVYETAVIATRRALILIERILDIYIERAAEMCTNVAEWVLQNLESAVAASLQTVINILERYGPTVEYYATSMKETIEDTYETVSEYSAPIIKKLTRNSLVRAVCDYVERVSATFEQFGIETIRKNARKAYVSIADTVADIYENVIDHPNVQYVNDMANHLARKTRDIYTKLGLEDLLGSVAEASKKHAYEMLMKSVQDAVEQYSQLRAGVHVDCRPENGIISLQMRLPVQKNSLAEALDLTSYPEYQKIQEMKDKYIDYSKDSLWDTYYKYKNYLSADSLMPPFKARGLIAGNQHYKTFDGTHFEFSGECSYLLARDFHNNDFTVVVNYAKDGQKVTKKSITVSSNGRNFDISSDYKVTLDGNKVELPQEIDGTTIKREEHSIIVENDNGLTVRCNLYYDQCVTEISGQYFGKTGGLMGTYDYEPKLDLMTPNRQIVDEADSFANEWQVGQGRCRKGPNMAEPLVADYRATETCNKYFSNDDSIFRPCYRQVDPAPFLKMCLHDMATASYNEMEEKVCISAAAYRDECAAVGVPLPMPRSCVRCEKPDGSEIMDGDIVRITGSEAAHTADVVFIVENKNCNKNVVPGLGRLAQGIEDSFRTKGYSNMRYAVVGFGGDGVFEEPHVHTADGQLFSSVRSVDSAFSSLTFGDGESNVFDAMRYALNLPYRTGSVKVIVLAKCTMCKAEDVESDYTDIYRTLLDRDVQLHVLDDTDFSVRSAGSKGKRIFGVDKKYAYTVKDLRDNALVGDADLHSQIRLPKDFCVPLALELNGTLFTSKRMMERRSVNKKFIDVFSRRIAMAEPSDCQVCECITSEDGVGQSICQRCVSPTIGSMMSPDFSPSLYSGDLESYQSSGKVRPKLRKLKLRRRQ